jgi:uncharacterized protein (DUF885 family)
VDKGLGDAFDVRPRLGLEVKPVPEFAQATAPGAYYQPGAFDGSRPGVFYANMRNTLETPKFAMATLAYHEGIPGHHYQIAIAQGLRLAFRRIVPFRVSPRVGTVRRAPRVGAGLREESVGQSGPAAAR